MFTRNNFPSRGLSPSGYALERRSSLGEITPGVHPTGMSYLYTSRWHFVNPCPAGGSQVQSGATPALHISRKKGSFLRPLHVRDFVKEGYLFVPRYEVWGVKSTYKTYAALTPSDSRSDWAYESAATKQAEDYKI